MPPAASIGVMKNCRRLHCQMSSTRRVEQMALIETIPWWGRASSIGGRSRSQTGGVEDVPVERTGAVAETILGGIRQAGVAHHREDPIRDVFGERRVPAGPPKVSSVAHCAVGIDDVQLSAGPQDPPDLPHCPCLLAGVEVVQPARQSTSLGCPAWMRPLRGDRNGSRLARLSTEPRTTRGPGDHAGGHRITACGQPRSRRRLRQAGCRCHGASGCWRPRRGRQARGRRSSARCRRGGVRCTARRIR